MSSKPIIRPAPDEYAPFYAGYTARVLDARILQVFESDIETILALPGSVLASHRLAAVARPG